VALPSLPMEGRLLHRRTSTDDWTCNLCGTRGPGGTDGFNRHYLREHSEPTENARRDR